MSDFTPGNWKWWTSNSYKRLVATDGISTTIVLAAYNAADGHPDIDIVADDMALIEQAPAMYEALMEVLKTIEDSELWWIDCPHRGGFDREKIEQVLAKARGEVEA